MNQPIIDSNFREEVEKFMVDKILSAIEIDQLDMSQMKSAANKILDNIDNLKNYGELITFLQSMKDEYPVLVEVYNLYKNKFYQDQEKDVINKLSQYIKSEAQASTVN